MKKDEEPKELCALVYNKIETNITSDNWLPFTYIKIYKDYYTALGHMVEEFNKALENTRKENYFNGKPEPISEQRSNRYSIKTDTCYIEWKIDRETVE